MDIKNKIARFFIGFSIDDYRGAISRECAAMSVIKALSKGENKCVELIESNDDLKNIKWSAFSESALVISGDDVRVDGLRLQVDKDFNCFAVFGNRNMVINSSVYTKSINELISDNETLRKRLTDALVEVSSLKENKNG